ncbi:MAG TPA: ABC transporter ATP-binding protein [Candidatus Limnocylindrales bacterium]|jgi:spermidine/putrescine transport system ATP-binding protein|nr:ABC transporter ATP-binding protein [Candidatus Limnocylindrales bacterium]
MTDAPSAVPGIELIDVTKRYGDALALDGISLRIESGEFFCLLGPSGCGKTTTLNLIGGFVPLTSGELRIEGRRVTDLPPHKRSVNTVFQNYALFPHMSVADNVAFGLRMEGLGGTQIDQRVGEYLDLVNLGEYRDRYPAQLSGGQAQRVALARALAKRPAVLLLDEPLGALDLKLRKQMQVELSRIHRQVGTTFVFVTHDQEEALSMATRIAVMAGGRVRQIGPPREIYLRPVDRFVADFIGESNFLDGVLTNGGGAPAFQLPNGTMLPAQSSPGSGSGPVKLMVRPESVSIGPTPPPSGTAAVVKGRTSHVAFMGSHTRITVRTDAGTLVAIRFRESDERAAEEEMVDREVHVWWDPRESTVVAAGDEPQVDEGAGGEAG